MSRRLAAILTSIDDALIHASVLNITTVQSEEQELNLIAVKLTELNNAISSISNRINGETYNGS